MMQRLGLFLTFALGLVSAASPQGLNLNNFGSQPVFSISNPTNNQSFCYNSTTGVWANGSCGGGGGGGGTVTTVTCVAANGFSCAIANPTTTPAITLSTSISGPLKGSSGALAAAGYSDIVGLFSGTPSSTCYLSGSGACSVPPGGAIPSTTDVLVGNGSGGAADSGAQLLSPTGSNNFFFGGQLASASAQGNYNLTLGYGAGTNLATSGVTNPQSNVLIGYLAGQNITTARASVAIGYAALEALTGTGAGVEDGIAVAIGAQAGLKALSAGSGSFVDIGEDAGSNATSDATSVMIGAHAGTSALSTTNDVAIGGSAFNCASTASATSLGNVWIGAQADGNVTCPTGTISYNVAVGYVAGYDMTGGAAYNFFGGYGGGYGCTSCTYNIAIGYNAGVALGSAQYNTFVGTQAGQNATAGGNTIIGYYAGNSLTSGSLTAFGEYAFDTVTTGTENVGFGALAGRSTTGNGNTQIGFGAAYQQSSGSNNTDVGDRTGDSLSTGSNNTQLGFEVGQTVLSTGNNNILIGTSNAVDTVTSSTSNEINIGGLLFYNNASTAAPTVSACGTSSIDSHANDKSGTVTTGTATSCTITFASAYTTWNHCRVTSQSALANFVYSYTLSAITVTATALSGGKIDYDCDGV